MAELQSFTVGEEDSGLRLDVYLTASLGGVSRSKVQKLIAAGAVLVNENPAPSRTILAAGDIVSGEFDFRVDWSVQPEDIPIDIEYEDSHLAVINKPRGLSVHPGAGRPSGTLVNALAHRYSKLPEGQEPGRPGIVHRLDKDTSGLMLVALSEEGFAGLSAMIANREVERWYHAIVWGNPRFQRAVVDASIGRDPRHPEKMAVLPAKGVTPTREAVTDLMVMERFEGASLIEAKLQTGRTHQIRVHCSYAGYPLIGDHLYGRKDSLPSPFSAVQKSEFGRILEAMDGQALHACRLAFRHPVTGEQLNFERAFPEPVQKLLEFFRKGVGGGKL